MTETAASSFSIPFIVIDESPPVSRELPRLPYYELWFTDWYGEGFQAQYSLTRRGIDGLDLDLGAVRVVGAKSVPGRPTLDVGTFHTLPADFVSLGQSFTYYEQIRDLPNGEGRELLRRLNDIVLDPGRLKQAESTPGAIQALASDDRALRALSDAPAIFGNSRSRSKSEIRWLYVHDFPSSTVELEFDFRRPSRFVSNRIAAIVGDNGAGKSAILAGIASTAGRRRPQSSMEGRIVGLNGAQIPFSRVIYIAYSAFDNHISPGERPSPTTADDVKQSRRRNFYFGLREQPLDQKDFWIDAVYGSLRPIEAIHEELSTALRSISGPRRHRALRRSLDLINEVTETPIRLDDTGERYSLTVGISTLSSGQLMVLNILVNLIAYLEPRSLVLIDEPETHLHPPLVSALIRGINEALNSFDSVAILATHSPVVIQEIPSSNVQIVRRSGHITWAARPQEETYGASLGTLTRQLFGMNSASPDYEATLERLSVGRSLEEVENLLGGRLSDQALSIVLAASDDRNGNLHG